MTVTDNHGREWELRTKQVRSGWDVSVTAQIDGEWRRDALVLPPALSEQDAIDRALAILFQ